MLNKYVGELIWMVSMTSLFTDKKGHCFYVSPATCPTFFQSSFYNENLTLFYQQQLELLTLFLLYSIVIKHFFLAKYKNRDVNSYLF